MCVPGRPVSYHPPVPVYRLAGAGGSQVGRGIHRLYRPGAQNQGAVRAGGTYHCPLQVGALVLHQLTHQIGFSL